MHAIAQRPAQMRMCSYDDNKEKNLRHPFWVEIPRFQHKKKYNNNIILYNVFDAKKKNNRKRGKKELYAHYSSSCSTGYVSLTVP